MENIEKCCNDNIKNPEKCKHSILCHYVYICRLECLPCKNVNKCPIIACNELSDLIKNIINGE